MRIVPLAPTSVPATSSSVFLSTKPPAATDRPVNAFSSEITIGTSAPPTGSTSNRPIARPATPSSEASPTDSFETRATASASATAVTPIISQRAPGSTTGRVVISSCSLANVTIEPANDTEPTSTVNAVATISNQPESCPLPPTASSTIATSAAAPPPTPLNIATS